MEETPKPIKRSGELVALSRDHHAGLLLCWKIRTGVSKGIATERIKKYVSFFFEHDLREHFRQEEAFLFPLLPADEPMRALALAQHVELSALIALLEQSDVDEVAMLLRFAEMLDAHIRFEERELFPHIERVTPADALTATGNALNELHGPREELPWEDQFWLLKK